MQNTPRIEGMSGYVVYDFQVSNIEGKILTLIESLGLKDTQEEATKSLARDIIHNLYRDTEYVSAEGVKSAIAITEKEKSTLYVSTTNGEVVKVN